MKHEHYIDGVSHIVVLCRAVCIVYRDNESCCVYRVS